MKNFLKKLHIGSNQSEDSERSNSSAKENRLSEHSSSKSNNSSEVKPFSTIQGWLNSVTHKKISSPPSSASLSKGRRMEPSDSVSSSGLEAALDAVLRDSESNNSRDADIEEEYQIQLALQLSAREDPEAVQIEAVKQISLGSCPTENTPAEVVAYRYWNYNALGYGDRILDGFYDLYGILTESTSTSMPSLIDLQQATVMNNVKWEAILVNRASDSKLLKLEQRALEMAVKSKSESVNLVNTSLVKNLASLVSNHMGGPVRDPDNMLIAWRSLSNSLKSTLNTMVLPLGSLKVGLARHRALLFKVLADSVSIPCRLVKGQEYTGSDDVAMNFVKMDDGREYIVDLMADPGTLIPADAVGAHIEHENLNSSRITSSSSGLTSSSEEHSESGGEKRSSDTTRNEISDRNEQVPPNENISEEGPTRPLEDSQKPYRIKKLSHTHSHVRSPSWTEGVSSPAVRRMKVKDVSQYMIDAAKENPQLAQKLHDVLLESGVVAPPDLFTEIYDGVEAKASGEDKGKKEQEICGLPPLPGEEKESKEQENCVLPPIAAAVVASSMIVAAAVSKQFANIEISPRPPESSPESPPGEAEVEIPEGEKKSDRSEGNESVRSDATFDDVADCEIPWDDITLGERIGIGSYGEVYHGDWHGTEVAVKKFLDQSIAGESLEEFKKEVGIMKRLRHPNIVLFMGAVTRPPNLSIVTEFLPRGSLYRLIHRPNNQLDERRRLRMALDAARGMNYLHTSTPTIVHRDLKSPNILVDKNWVVKVCDFGLSRMKHSTFLSSRSSAGTAEWMAPEVLRNELSDEKCDVYSYGVILWELFTLRQPWDGLNPMQVVGAVGFQYRRLDIPDDIDPVIADLIGKCWQTDPKLRPSFAEIMAILKPLQKPITNSQVPRPNAARTRNSEAVSEQ